ncbi:hypothetical protein [Allonocardiopsis opalescens]|uniref:LPXTG-motif cell wall-anchored protein n=1 Tax=Allonocardiopsis opalescens TaxID=1144618 RepID=A0A2T0PT91_9ACTN|nr:hypothetical protein [Allonocardiopsis opalescens]PRX92115.1 hypothetical protein CLV72_1113 [Allonocardiopsis opalescens]
MRMKRLIALPAAMTIAGTGFALMAPAAAADEIQTYSESVPVTCTLDGEAWDEAGDLNVVLGVPESAETGTDLEVYIQELESTFGVWPDQPIAAGDASVTVDLVVGGAAATQDSLTLTGTNPEETAPGGTLEWGDITGSMPLTRPGDLTFGIGSVTVDVQQDRGPSVTVCTPDSSPAIATVTVTGDDQEPTPDPSDPGEEPSPDPSEPGEEPTPEPSESEDPSATPSASPSAPAMPDETDDDEAGDGEGALPVTGAQLSGLVAAGAIAIGGGVAAMVVARKRRASAVTDDQV